MTKSEKPSEEFLLAPSKEFLLAIKNSRSGVSDCDFCERTHFSPDSDFAFHEGELEELLENHKKDPDKYIVHEGHGVEGGHLNGRFYVLDCPCNSASKYEDFIWNHRYLIADYFSARYQKMAQQAKDAESVSSKVNSSL